MGNTESGDYQKRLSPAEQTEDAIGNALPAAMCQRIFRGMQSVNVTGKTSVSCPEISKEQFTLFLIDILRGTAEEKSGIIIRMVCADNSEQVTGSQAQQFLEDLVLAVVYVLRHQNALSGWSLENTRDCGSGARALALQLLSQIKPPGGQTLEGPELITSSYTRVSVEDWLYKVPMISMFLRVVVTLGVSVMKKNPEHHKDMSSLIPMCRRGKHTSFASLLDFPSIMFLNTLLPSEMQHKWRLLFSTSIHGESFSQLCGHLVDQGPSLLVLRDRDGFIFGGFASQNWEVKPQYQGDSRCFLFTVSPQLDVYTYSGYNDHYMYLNHGQQTMPNGLGMGGQHDYFGLWIDSNFGKGHSKAKPRCTTYNSPQLSAKEEFQIDGMELWALGDLPEHVLAKTKKSILDVDPEARALLEMTGRTRQSDGLREKDED
ncbi:MTOR-associated protein MEAK7 isoform X2 [Pseudophryne corroboree]|uniref:MTOR-associated protein MEAK7 isoform X2 n=1 Tax=Pseudophryne corroboree TaxID=495146 RepID=UPI0030819CF6